MNSTTKSIPPRAGSVDLAARKFSKARSIAERLGICPRTIFRWADAGKKPALPPAIFLTGRSALVADLDKFLAGSPGILSIQTASPDDLRDAIAAWWKTCAEKAPPPLSGTIVQTTAAWEYLPTIDHPMLLLLEDGVGATPEQITAAIGNGHFLVRRTSEVSERHCRLPSFPTPELSHALVSAGIDPKRAWKLASDADGSGVILKYLLAGSAVPPPWAQGAGTVKLAPLVLIGSWDQSLKGDRERVAKIGGTRPRR